MLDIVKKWPIKMFKTFLPFETQYRGSVDQYLLSHPLSSDRLLQMQNYHNVNKVNGFADEDVKKFQRIVEKMNAFFTPIDQLLNDKRNIDQLSPYMQSIIFYRQSNVSKALRC